MGGIVDERPVVEADEESSTKVHPTPPSDQFPMGTGEGVRTNEVDDREKKENM